MHSYTVAVLEGGSEVVKASRCKYRGVGALSGPGNPSGNVGGKRRPVTSSIAATKTSKKRGSQSRQCRTRVDGCSAAGMMQSHSRHSAVQTVEVTACTRPVERQCARLKAARSAACIR
ncbi:hypothetical protein Y1Q_0023482 [Alligator mississippiensis]|uniref:Uncharacterized protein n=1 Tax=Alligator mississippiensis TaxID=8496 RepID=A0A151NPR0_ALLMI|nr:hypothetical protein Y1Q_0023482 [Alligator mississippiensis]